MTKIHMLIGHTTPTVFCAKLTEVADEIENIACVVKYKTGETHVFNTAMDDGEKAWFRWVFDQDFRPSDGERDE